MGVNTKLWRWCKSVRDSNQPRVPLLAASGFLKVPRYEVNFFLNFRLSLQPLGPPSTNSIRTYATIAILKPLTHRANDPIPPITGRFLLSSFDLSHSCFAVFLSFNAIPLTTNVETTTTTSVGRSVLVLFLYMGSGSWGEGAPLSAGYGELRS